jgi:DTW domain-containing protein YfiP
MTLPPTVSSPEPRATCPRCFRPTSGCFCSELQPIATKTRVVILQHPRERDVGIGTVRLARVGLAGAELRRGIDFSDDRVVREVAASGNAYVLFPGDDAIDVETANFAAPITLIVVDGTWRQAQKLIHRNPALAALPRLRLSPRAPSLYGEIRREPAAHCVATVEAIAHVLGYLENDQQRFSALLRPMAAMVAQQRAFASEVASNRHLSAAIKRNAAKVRVPRDPIPALLRDRPADVVCLLGEANAWPRFHPDRNPPEIVHWLARRIASGEDFSAVIAPRRTLAPSTSRHLRVSEQALLAGESWPSFSARWAAFVRPTDVLVYWGPFSLATAMADGLVCANPHLDARVLASRVLKQRTGTLEACLTAMSLPEPSPVGDGRGGERAARLFAVVDKLCHWPLASTTAT